MSTADESRAPVLYVKPGTRKLRNTKSLKEYLEQRQSTYAVRAGWRVRLKDWWKSSSRGDRIGTIIAVAAIATVLIAAATLGVMLLI
jgi:hypothetical protein